MEITNITLCPNQDYLLGCDKEGFLYIWAFKEILVSIIFALMLKKCFLDCILKIKL